MDTKLLEVIRAVVQFDFERSAVAQGRVQALGVEIVVEVFG